MYEQNKTQSRTPRTQGPTLSPQDAQAVDLILGGLDQSARNGATGSWGSAWGGTSPGGNAAGSKMMSGFTAQTSTSGTSTSSGAANIAGRVDAADRLLKLLDHLPADEPPASLLAATMRRVEEARSADGMPTGPATRLPGQPSTGTGRTVARDADAPDGA